MDHLLHILYLLQLVCISGRKLNRPCLVRLVAERTILNQEFATNNARIFAEFNHYSILKQFCSFLTFIYPKIEESGLARNDCR